jgi:TonB family protein
VCANVEVRPRDDTNRKFDASAALNACLVEGDAAQRARARALRRRSLIFSVMTQLAIIAGLILVPIFSKTEHIAMANVMPLPPYRPTRVAVRETRAPTEPPRRIHGFQFCLSCAAVVPPERTEDLFVDGSTELIEGPGLSSEPARCAECEGIAGGGRTQPVAPPEVAPKKITITHIDPAMLMHRVDPIFPVLARQTGREGTVELHAIIAADGSVQSLEVLHGDSLFFQSALDAVRQWRYRPTVLNGRPVEVDTHITVIYRLAR